MAIRIRHGRPPDPSPGDRVAHNGYFDTSFMPGRMFASLADFNAPDTGRPAWVHTPPDADAALTELISESLLPAVV
jgi:hypothetical protein